MNMFRRLRFPGDHEAPPGPERVQVAEKWLYRTGSLAWHKTASTLLLPLLCFLGSWGLYTNDTRLLELFSPLADGVFLFGTVAQARNFVTTNDLSLVGHAAIFVLHAIPPFLFFMQPRSYNGIAIAVGVLLVVFLVYLVLNRYRVDAWPYSVSPLEGAALMGAYYLVQLV